MTTPGFTMRIALISIAFIGLATFSSARAEQPVIPVPDAGIVYTVARNPWPEGLGSQRALFDVSAPGKRVHFTLPWRRHDPDPANHRLLLIHEASGDTVREITRVNVTSEVCEFIAGPCTRAGRYALYYLSYDVQPGWGWFSHSYHPAEGAASSGAQTPPPATDASAGVEAVARAIEARTAFDSFFPMEVIATAKEREAFLATHTTDCIVFPEDRTLPIRMKDALPFHWMRRELTPYVEGVTGRNEFFTFQLGVYAARTDLHRTHAVFGDLLDKHGYRIPASRITCFNTDGVDASGAPFHKDVHVPRGTVQPLWIGVDIPGDIHPGSYAGSVEVRSDGVKEEVLLIRLIVRDTLFADRGDGEPWRHSRLRWLNSTLGIDSTAVAPFTPIRTDGDRSVSLTGKTIELDGAGLPTRIRSLTGSEILAAPARFVIETTRETLDVSQARPVSARTTDGMRVRTATAQGEDLHVAVTSTIEADGYLRYAYTITARKEIRLKDVRLELPFTSASARTMIGMGRMGSEVPDRYYGIWEGSHDSFWIGDQNGGVWCELRGARYTGPLLDLFKPGHPQSWWNDRKGGFSIRKEPSRTLATVFSGARRLAAGDSLSFSFALLITPVKRLDMAKHFRDRYYHGGGLLPNKEEIAAGVRIVNLHHANPANPYINYPFLTVPTLRRFVDSAHAQGLKLKLYYTVRELTNHLPELWALRSLGDEVLADGPGGGFTWLREHCVSGYTPQWYQHFDTGDLGVDAAMLTAEGPSRWYNFYIEGLRWLLVNTGIDGSYLDDVAFDRETVKRMRKVMESVKPGCLIDLHSNTFFSKGPANQYTEFFPYIDRLWFGEGFQYDRMPPENWFVEVSGIPFGLTGDMLEGGGNPWRGMLYGMTVRYPWVTDDVSCDPRAIWKVWDAFGMDDARMKGYWEDAAPVRTGHPDVLATTYAKPGRALIAVASWAHDPVDVRLTVDWKELGLDPARSVLRAPAIDHYQPARTFNPQETIPVEPGRGWLLFVEPAGR